MAAIRNHIKRSVAPRSSFEDAKNVIGSSTTFNQGDHLVLDTVTHLIKRPAAETDSATYLGISRVSIVDGKVAQPYTTDVDASQAIVEVPGPQSGVVATFEAKAGDAFPPGVRVGLDPANLNRGVSSTITTRAVGIYQGPNIASATAGQLIEVLVSDNYADQIV